MSYIVHGVEVPKNCGGCDRKRVCAERIYLLRRPDSCPLEEIETPHGRLKDVDALKLALRKTMGACVDEDGTLLYSDHLIIDADYDEICNVIDEQPTIIEAEGSET